MPEVKARLLVGSCPNPNSLRSLGDLGVSAVIVLNASPPPRRKGRRDYAEKNQIKTPLVSLR
jgi:hypothetical protein